MPSAPADAPGDDPVGAIGTATSVDADEDAARREIEAAAHRGRKSAPRSGIFANLLLFAALLAVILVVIKKMNEGAPKEISPFEAPPPSSAMTPPATGERPPPAAGEGFSGTVTVADAVGAAPSGTLYVIVRMAGAPDRGPPIAVKRVDAPRFPVSFSVGPGDVMQPGLPFDGPFDVRARLDTDGNAMTKSPGDLTTSTAVEVEPGAGGDIEVVLDERIE